MKTNEIIRVVILADQKTAFEINKNRKPQYTDTMAYADQVNGDNAFNEDYNKWVESEKLLRTFKIINPLTEGWIPSYNNPDNNNFDPMAEPAWNSGDVHEAKIIADSLIEIIPND